MPKVAGPGPVPSWNRRELSFSEGTATITGADEVESYILLCMQESPWQFELMDHGAGIGARCLAYTAPVGQVMSINEEGDCYDGNDKSETKESECCDRGAVQ